MGFETYKFAVPKEALKMETEYNLGYCKEIQRGKIVDCGGIINPQKCLEEVDWDSCVKIENDAIKPNPEDTFIDISAFVVIFGAFWSGEMSNVTHIV